MQTFMSNPKGAHIHIMDMITHASASPEAAPRR